MRIYTIGHSTRSLEEMMDILERFEVRLLADVRSIPRSRHNPQFNSDSFAKKLANRGIDYQHLDGLGGLRKTRADSPNTGWRNEGSRGYADYMQTPEFKEALDYLIEQADANMTAIMCAEAVPWRCHRSLISDALLVRDVEVCHIMTRTRHRPQLLLISPKVHGTDITYPSSGDGQQSLTDL